MKKNYTPHFYVILVLIVLELFTTGSLHAQYCAPTNIGNFNTNYISNVSFGSIDNSSSGSTAGYTYFSSLQATDVKIGETITGTVTVTVNGWNTNKNTISVWVNFNSRDDDFEGSGEQFLFTFHDKNSKSGNKTVEVPISIPVPNSTKSGLSRMRIGLRTGKKTDFTSCDYNYQAGEIEDYKINFTEGSSGGHVGSGSDDHEKQPEYCSPNNIGNFNVNYISNVALGSINNSSSGSTGGYTYFSSLSETDIEVGKTITGTVTVTVNGWNTNTNTVAIWMNLNEDSDDDFEDSGERFLFTFRDTNSRSGNKTVEVPISITVPNTVPSGSSIIRIGLRTGENTNFTSCDFNYQAGEIEDYKVNFTTSNDEDEGKQKTDGDSGNMEVSIDTDGDGVMDSDDLDDDNDGILDVNECTNLLTESGFNNKAGLSFGNNIGVDISPWILGSGNQANIVRVDGSGGYEYNNGGPFEDANVLTGDGQDQYYLDIASGSNDFYQAFTIASNSKLTYGGYFSSRDGLTGSGRLRIFTGTEGDSGTLIADSGTFTISPDGGNSSTTPWEYIEESVIVNAGTYSFVVSMDNDTNFDEGFAIACYDTDGDGILDYKDLDSDADGCPDAFEGGGNFTASDLVTNTTMEGGSTDIFDNLGLGADTNNDGLLDIAGPNGQSAGNSKDPNQNDCPEVIDFDGKDDVLKTPDTFSLNNWNQLTIQFWVKSNALAQSNAGVVGQKGVVEITQNGSLSFEIFGQGAEGVFTNAKWLNNTDAWQHVTLVYNRGKIQCYYNGKKEYEATSARADALANSSNSFNIGGLIKTGSSSNFFNGWIDEVRVFNVALTESQIQQIVYQEIDNDNGYVKGSVIQKDVKDVDTGSGLSWSDLQLYYKMGDHFLNRKAMDFSQNERHASLHNIYTKQTETAPMPYVTKKDGNLNDNSIWLHSDVWNSPSSSNIPVESTIIHISHDVTMNHDLENVGLIIDPGKTLTVGSDGSDYQLKNNWYLELNGTLDLLGDSQLIQTNTSDLVTSATGKILRRQEGTSNKYRYNYWGSPVGALGVTGLTDNNAATNNANNAPFKLNMLKDESGFGMQFTSAYDQVGKLSTYWIYTYKNGTTYWDWGTLSPNSALAPGVGYTQKGTGNAGMEQQYIFEGKPNNGTILINAKDKGGAGSVTAVSKTEYLLGNPYPSALDIHKFIDDNAGVIEGSLQLWQQWAGNSHNLRDYEGGYAQVNKLGSVRAYQFVGLYGATSGSQNGTITPSKYLPVGQGFIVEIVADGIVKFNNGQRVFIKESDADGSYNNGASFFKSSNVKSKNTTSNETAEANPMQKIRLEFYAVSGPKTRRELLLGFSEITSDAFDYGYDAECTESNNNDFNLNFEGKNMNLQAYGPITGDKVVPLNFKSSGNNTFEIKISDLENIEEGQEIYLKDNLTGEYFDLTTKNAYKFSSKAGKFNKRFEMVFQSESQTLSAEASNYSENFIYYQSSLNTLFAKKLNASVTKLAIISMTGQTVLEFKDVSPQTLNNGLSISNVAAGAYVAWFRTDDGQVLTKKLIVN
tara:strand:- start:95688 stop:100307 length:4620 start_codon:yes stop_codon:yes gene_type:complete